MSIRSWLLILAATVPVVSASGVTSSIGPAGQVIIDGKPPVPVAVWIQPAYLFEYHRQMGATCMISPSRERGPFRDSARDTLAAAEKRAVRTDSTNAPGI